MRTECGWCRCSLEAPGPERQLYCNECSSAIESWAADYPQRRSGGVVLVCTMEGTGSGYVLLGHERRRRYVWSTPHGLAERSDANVLVTALREGAEEICYALGTPRDMMARFVKTGCASRVTNSAFMLSMGTLSRPEMMTVLETHRDNIRGKGPLGRDARHCESEMQELVWVSVREIQEALRDATEREVVVRGLVDPMRGAACGLFTNVLRNKGFQEACPVGAPPEPFVCLQDPDIRGGRWREGQRGAGHDGGKGGKHHHRYHGKGGKGGRDGKGEKGKGGDGKGCKDRKGKGKGHGKRHYTPEEIQMRMDPDWRGGSSDDDDEW